jgi:hypothetical protein
MWKEPACSPHGQVRTGRGMARTLVLLAVGSRRQEVDRKLFFPGFSRESVITVGFSISKLVEVHIPIHEKN